MAAKLGKILAFRPPRPDRTAEERRYSANLFPPDVRATMTPEELQAADIIQRDWELFLVKKFEEDDEAQATARAAEQAQELPRWTPAVAQEQEERYWLWVESVHEAARQGDFVAVAESIRDGCGRDLLDAEGRHMLHNGAAHHEIVMFLLRIEADPDVPDQVRQRPLHYAIRAGARRSIEELLEAGADPDAVDDFDVSPRVLAQGRSDVADLFAV